MIVKADLGRAVGRASASVYGKGVECAHSETVGLDALTQARAATPSLYGYVGAVCDGAALLPEVKSFLSGKEDGEVEFNGDLKVQDRLYKNSGNSALFRLTFLR